MNLGGKIMSELVKVSNDKVITDLRTVSQMFGKTIFNLNKIIHKLIGYDATLNQEFIKTTYIDAKGEESILQRVRTNENRT